MKTSEVIRDVSLDLNDQVPGYEYTRWTSDQLYSYLVEAYGFYLEEYLLAEYDSLFHTRRVVKILPGNGWQEACDCKHIVRVLGETTADGRHLHTLQRMDDEDNNTWFGLPRPTCGSSLGERLRGYSINKDDDRLFRVVPSVRGGQVRYVLVDCYTDPDDYDRTPPGMDDTLPREFTGMAKQWMLHRALMVDSENNSTIITVADKHKETFFQLLTDYRQRKQREKENEKELERDRRNSSVPPVQNRSSR